MLEGMTAVLTGFFVFCLWKQEMIKSRTYYYATFGCLLAIILFNVLFYFASPAAVTLQGICAVMLGLLHAGALILTMAYVGGLSLRQMAGEMKQAADEIRTSGESKKPVIVPIGQDKPRVKDAYEEEERQQRERPRISIELPKRED